MKTATPEMAAHLQQDTTSLTVCWRLTRVDGTRYHFTALDRDVVFDIGDGPETYSSLGSFTRTAVANTDDLAVDNLDVFGALGELVDAQELERGLFNNALIEIFVVNWDDLTMGSVKLRRGWIGEVTSTPEGIFKAEMRGMAQALIRKVGRVITPECDADLGDVRCGVPIKPAVRLNSHSYAVGDRIKLDVDVQDTYQCTVAGSTAVSAPSFDTTIGNTTVDGTVHWLAVSPWQRFNEVIAVDPDLPRKKFGVSSAETFSTWPPATSESYPTPESAKAGYNVFPDGSMNNGVVLFTTGRNAGVAMEIREWTAGSGGDKPTPAIIELYLPMPFNIEVGDEIRMYRGCFKRVLSDCRDVFDNVVNFRGFPGIPGSDFLAQYPNMH